VDSRTVPDGSRAACDTPVTASSSRRSAAPCLLDEARAFVGDARMAGAALDQADAQLVLQPREALAHGRRRETEAPRGTGQAAGRRHLEEGEQSPQSLHAGILDRRLPPYQPSMTFRTWRRGLQCVPSASHPAGQT
jgi:hypothetical protein